MMSTTLFGQPGSECLCTDLRTWTTALQRAGGQVSVVTNLPAVPLGFSAVHVVLPGVGILRDVPLTRASGRVATLLRARAVHAGVLVVPGRPASSRLDRRRVADAGSGP